MLAFILMGGFAGLLLYGSTALPRAGAQDAPAHRRISAAGTTVAGTYYIQNAYRDAHTKNMVTVVLVDYRAFDTLGETIVLLTAALASAFALREP